VQVEAENTQMPKLGNILKQARLAGEMTLEQLSSKCGYSKALISRIENDSVSPSITSLAEISSALHLKLHDVFASLDDAAPAIVRKTERRKFSLADGKQEIEYLSNGIHQKKMQPLLVCLHNGSKDSGASTAHHGEEFLHVLQGKIQLALGEKTFVLGPGDSILFKSTIPHSYRGIGRGKTISLKIAYPPFF